MNKSSEKDAEQRKKMIFDSMSLRRQKQILKKGYGQWNPFQEPKDPIDIRKDKTKRTSQDLIREFLRSRSSEDYSPAYGQGVFEICMGIINDDERYIAMFDFSSWYNELLKKEGYRWGG